MEPKLVNKAPPATDDLALAGTRRQMSLGADLSQQGSTFRFLCVLRACYRQNLPPGAKLGQNR
jgi:hypothetical protein